MYTDIFLMLTIHISQLFVTHNIDSSNVLLRKAVFSLKSQISVSEYILVKTVVTSSYGLYRSHLYKK